MSSIPAIDYMTREAAARRPECARRASRSGVMSERPHGISRRHFFFGTLLAGVIPRGGFGTVSLSRRSAISRRTRR